MGSEITIKIKQLRNDLRHIPIPSYSTNGSSGMDVCAAIVNPIIIKPGSLEMIPTNLSVEIPPGYEIQVRPRSGLAANYNIGILNSPGTIDSDYRGEIKIIMMNFGKKEFTISPADRIAQLVVAKVYIAKLSNAAELNDTIRGEGGFGHTGK